MVRVSIIALAGALPMASAFIGMGIDMYDPVCAYACRAVMASAEIACDTSHDHDDMDMGGMDMGDMSMKKRHSHESTITPACRAMSEPFLTSLAYCINSTCPHETKAWVLEKYWLDEATGEPGVEPMWGYELSIMHVNATPETTYDSHEMMNQTQILDKQSWEEQRASLKSFSDGEAIHARYALILFIVGLGIPVLTTLLTYLPFCNRLIANVKPYAIYPALFRGHNVQAVARWLHFPTSGQTIYIAIFTILNIILSAVGYISVQPNTWWDTLKTEMLSKVGARTGVLAMGLAPLVILTAGRNSVLLWLTNWSHSTYLLLHRWIARLFGIQVIVHSITELAQYVAVGTYSEELVEEYWIWGCVATVACSIMLVISVFRASAYEWFLVTHIILAVIVLAGTWYHLDLLFEDRWGYKYWLYACFAIWGFDRLIRIGRVLKNGMRSTTFRPVGDEILRVDIKGVKWSTAPGQHAYVYFPILRKFTPWENHPFSVIPSHFLRPVAKSPTSSTRGETLALADTPSHEKDLEHLTPSSTNTLEHGPRNAHHNHSVDGITFFIKKNSGLTKHLWSSNLRTTTLVEGPYTGTSSRPVLLCDRLILIAGGIGITSIFPFVPSHTNVKIYWSMRASQGGMINEISPALRGVENEIVTGQRLDLEGLLTREVEGGWKDLGVVVCGPGGMCDEVRQLVVRISKETKVKIELDVEAFAW